MLDLTRLCDRCGATAHNRWIHSKDGRDLLLCNHHHRECAPKLIEQGFLAPVGDMVTTH